MCTLLMVLYEAVPVDLRSSARISYHLCLSGSASAVLSIFLMPDPVRSEA